MQKLTAALAGIMLIAGPAFAQDPVIVEGGAPTAAVSYADLDLGSASGLATLKGRISRAASRLCTESGRKDVDTQLSEARCFKTAIASAKPQVEHAVADRSLRMAAGGTITVAAR